MKYQVNKWYYAHYGFDTVLGKCLSVNEYGVVLSFRWGTLNRGANFIDNARIIGEGDDPRWITKLKRLFTNGNPTGT